RARSITLESFDCSSIKHARCGRRGGCDVLLPKATTRAPRLVVETARAQGYECSGPRCRFSACRRRGLEWLVDNPEATKGDSQCAYRLITSPTHCSPRRGRRRSISTTRTFNSCFARP